MEPGTHRICPEVTAGTGRFNLAQGSVGAASGVGATLSTSVFGYTAGLLGVTSSFWHSLRRRSRQPLGPGRRFANPRMFGSAWHAASKGRIQGLLSSGKGTKRVNPLLSGRTPPGAIEIAIRPIRMV